MLAQFKAIKGPESWDSVWMLLAINPYRTRISKNEDGVSRLSCNGVCQFHHLLDSIAFAMNKGSSLPDIFLEGLDLFAESDCFQSITNVELRVSM